MLASPSYRFGLFAFCMGLSQEHRAREEKGLRPTLSTQGTPGQPGLHSEALPVYT